VCVRFKLHSGAERSRLDARLLRCFGAIPVAFRGRTDGNLYIYSVPSVGVVNLVNKDG
jgi:hypothetical protein